jgi:pyruvate/2-oxoglutarate dehydrogenase complex dihydrolipoamide dehydrogenase (E3) component
LILGGGYIGLEFAQMFRRFGARVTLIEAGPQLLAGDEDADVTTEMARLLRTEGVGVRVETKAEHVETNANGDIRLTARSGDGPPETLAGTHLLVATGRTPNTTGLGLEAAGVILDDNRFIQVNERLETSAQRVWTVGEAAGSPGFTHIAYDDFQILRDQLLGDGKRTTTGRLVPQTVFTDPQLGHIGLSEKQARAAGHTIRVAKVAARDLARPRETGEATGFIKAVVDADTQQILGFAAFCREGGELMGAVTVALMARLPYPAVRDGIFSHPTLVESLNNLFLALDATGAR